MNEIMRLLNVDPLILQALREDMPGEDVSTNAVMPTSRPGTVDLLAKQDGVIAGLDVFARVFTLLDAATEVELLCKDRRAGGHPRAPIRGTGRSQLPAAHERYRHIYPRDGQVARGQRHYLAGHAQDEPEQPCI